MDFSPASILAYLLVVLAVVAGTYYAYEQGYLDPVIEEVGYVFLSSVPLPPFPWQLFVYAATLD